MERSLQISHGTAWLPPLFPCERDHVLLLGQQGWTDPILSPKVHVYEVSKRSFSSVLWKPMSGHLLWCVCVTENRMCSQPDERASESGGNILCSCLLSSLLYSPQSSGFPAEFCSPRPASHCEGAIPFNSN